MSKKKETELVEFKRKHDDEVKKLNDEISKLNLKLLDSRKDDRQRLVASALPHSSIERNKLMDSARTSRTKD